MKFILAIALAIPTYGLSLLVLIFYLWFSHGKMINAIPRIIMKLSEDKSSLGVCVDKLEYPALLGYAHEEGNITFQSDDHFEFDLKFKSEDNCLYKVKVSRDAKNKNVILSVSKLILLSTDEYTSASVPISLYQYWMDSGLDERRICEYYSRGFTDALNETAEFLNNGGTWDEWSEKLKKEEQEKQE